jgi:uncharacterized protein (DUF924 family)
MPDWTDAVLRFWFETLRPKDWWSASPGIDARVRERFAPLLASLATAPPDPATLDARAHVAAVVVLDQFSRHVHRGSPLAYANDATARAIANDALARGLDAPLTVPQRQFLYMPLMHSESLDDQLRSIALFTALGEAGGLRSAEDHRRTIDRFGRFPSRNALLGRESTDEERAFLIARREG